MKNVLKLYKFGVGVGVSAISSGVSLMPRVFEMIWSPMNYWRCIETPLILNNLHIDEGDKILDSGSPKLLSLYIGKVLGNPIVASDVNPYFKEYCSNFAKVLKITKNYTTRIIDACSISDSENEYDKIYSLSVIEHIPSDGDVRAMKEYSRVLKNNGLLLLTLPYSHTYKEEYRKPKKFYYSNNKGLQKNQGKVFYQRVYDEKSLNERILKPSNLEIIKKEYVGERLIFRNRLLSHILGPLNILFSLVNHIGPVDNANNLKNPGIVFLVLKKTSDTVTLSQ